MRWLFWFLNFKMTRFLILFLFVSSWLGAQQLRVETDASEISYEASHVVHDWSGTSKQVQGVVVLETFKHHPYFQRVWFLRKDYFGVKRAFSGLLAYHP